MDRIAIELLNNLAAGQAAFQQNQGRLIEAATSAIQGPPALPAPSGITVRDKHEEPPFAAAPTDHAAPPWKQPEAQSDPKDLTAELEEILMAELERHQEGITPKALGERIEIPGKTSDTPNHQFYRFRKAIQNLVSAERIVRLPSDNPAKLKYCIAAFVAESP
jgi:hypothetical protein